MKKKGDDHPEDRNREKSSNDRNGDDREEHRESKPRPARDFDDGSPGGYNDRDQDERD